VNVYIYSDVNKKKKTVLIPLEIALEFTKLHIIFTSQNCTCYSLLGSWLVHTVCGTLNKFRLCPAQFIRVNRTKTMLYIRDNVAPCRFIKLTHNVIQPTDHVNLAAPLFFVAFQIYPRVSWASILCLLLFMQIVAFMHLMWWKINHLNNISDICI
jgi:hypothetical protein